jgi:hypothetical protein
MTDGKIVSLIFAFRKDWRIDIDRLPSLKT